jgi:hypothetical protein
MVQDIIENTLGFRDFLTKQYLLDTINLVKSIIIKNSNEAIKYNELVELRYPSHQINYNSPSTWRYYKHLNGEYHAVDTPMTMISLDNNSTIVINKANMAIHKKTRKKLLQYSQEYYLLASKYPEQELLLRAILNDTNYTQISDIINLEDYTIVSYNKDLVEKQEDDLIPELNSHIQIYKTTRLIDYYNLSDSYFLAAQYFNLYYYMLQKILALRLNNVKTTKAHSYHIKNYFASHYGIDKHYRYLSDKQIIFLYRNLLYLQNHSGHSYIFNDLIDYLFTEANISMVNYIFKQTNVLDDEDLPIYNFNQKLLNNKNLLYSPYNFPIEYIKNKEYKLALSNYKYWNTYENTIKDRFHKTLFSILTTKDIESILVDATDSVRYKFIPMMIDYWAYLLKTNRIDYIVEIVNPASNTELRLNTSEAFRLFIAALYFYHEEYIETFPDYTIKRVFREVIPSNEELLRFCYRRYYWYRYYLDEIRTYIGIYPNIYTSFNFYTYFLNVYLLNIGFFILFSNLDDKDANAEFEYMIRLMHQTTTYSLNNENVDSFLANIGFPELRTLDKNSLDTIMRYILNAVFDDRLDFLDKQKYRQEALVDIFKNFKSYTTQLINSYYQNSSIVSIIKDTRYAVSEDIISKRYVYDMLNLEVDYKITTNYKYSVDNSKNFYDNPQIKNFSYYSYSANIPIDLNVSVVTKAVAPKVVSVMFTTNVTSFTDPSWMPVNVDQELLQFLSFNA